MGGILCRARPNRGLVFLLFPPLSISPSQLVVHTTVDYPRVPVQDSMADMTDDCCRGGKWRNVFLPRERSTLYFPAGAPADTSRGEHARWCVTIDRASRAERRKGRKARNMQSPMPLSDARLEICRYAVNSSTRENVDQLPLRTRA